MPFRFRIKSWTLAILALVGIILFTTLGFWQLHRANYKRALIALYTERTERTPFHVSDLSRPFDWRYFRLDVEGEFDNDHTILLDNKTFHGQVGYEVYTPFRINNSDINILVDRGFVPANTDRNQLPEIRSLLGTINLIGMLNMPPQYVALGAMTDSSTISWPLRVEFISTEALSKLLHYPLFQYVLIMDAHDPNAYPVEWKITNMIPEKHQAYAVQWFALALLLLLLFVALNCERPQ